ncbi:MAG: SGNH/GDSL hydrolase family protein [Bacteroidota bacterium]
MTTRRHFLRLSAMTSFSSAVIPDLVKAANQHFIPSGNEFSAKGPTILFQGDSITDAGRDRGRYYANEGSGMGGGYVHHIVTHLLGKYPKKDYHCYNRGISGHKVFQLADRWEDDCLQLQPDVLSLLIGVNDYWHTLDWGYNGTVETYENDLRKLLARTKKELPQIQLIIGEPFAVTGGSAINERWDAFHDYRHVCKAVANDMGAVFLPYHSIFEEALKVAPVDYWCPDGVHPSLAGAYLMKEAWLAGFGELGK